MKPTRCCVQTLKGTRCANEPSPVRSTRMIGPVEIAACGLDGHQRAMRGLPDFVRHDAYCGAVGCDRPSNAGICPKHRDQYRDFGITEHALLAQEAPMTEPTPLSKLPDLGFARIQVQTSCASLADLEAAVAKVTPPAEPQETAGVGAPSEPHPLEARRDRLVATLLGVGFMERPAGSGQVRRFVYDNDYSVIVPDGPAAESQEGFAAALDTAEAALKRLTSTVDAPHLPVVPAPVDAVEPSEGDVDDAYSGRWGQYTAPVQPMSPDLAALATRGQQPTAPGPTLAEVQAELARERERADRAELDAVAERARADEALEELATIAAMLDPEDAPAYDSDDQPIPLPVRVQTALMPHSESVLVRGLRAERDAFWGIINDTEWIVHHCGSYGATASLADRVLRLLPVERQRAILELKRSEAYIEVARINARFLNPPPPGRLEECAAEVAEVEAKIVALDAGEVRE